MTHDDRFDCVEIAAGDTYIEVHAPDEYSSAAFTTLTNDPEAFESDVLRSAIAVAGMLTTFGRKSPMRPERLAASMPGDTEANIDLIIEMRDSDYAPIGRHSVPSWAVSHGLIELTGDTDEDALAYLDFLGTFAVDVTAVRE